LSTGSSQVSNISDVRGFDVRREWEFTDEDREGGVGRGANVHRLRAAVDADLGTLRRLGNDGSRQRALWTEHDVCGFELLRARRGRDEHAGEGERAGKSMLV
jgi:hypothetical protein